MERNGGQRRQVKFVSPVFSPKIRKYWPQNAGKYGFVNPGLDLSMTPRKYRPMITRETENGLGKQRKKNRSMNTEKRNRPMKTEKLGLGPQRKISVCEPRKNSEYINRNKLLNTGLLALEKSAYEPWKIVAYKSRKIYMSPETKSALCTQGNIGL